MIQRWIYRLRERCQPECLSEWMALLLILLFYAVRDIPVLLYGGQILAFGTILWIKKGLKSRYTLAWLLFISWAALSGLWATNHSHYLKFMREISQMGALCVLFHACCDSRERIEKYLQMIALVSVVMIVYFLIKTPRSDWKQAFNTTVSAASSSDRFGRSIGYHPNSFGTLCAVEMGVCLFLWRNRKQNGYLIISAVLLILLLFSKSRTAIAFIGLLIVAYYVLERKNIRKTLIRLLLIAGGVFLGLWLVLNVQPLYKLVGYRVSGVLAFLTGDGVVDASVRGRNELMNAGWAIIREHPLFGVGARNYSNVAYESNSIWRDVYAHSNLIELWADLGLVGWLLYYVPRIWCTIRLVCVRRTMKKRGEGKLCSFLLAFMITNLITDYFYISYTIEFVQLMFTVCFAYAEIAWRQTEPERVKRAKQPAFPVFRPAKARTEES